MRHLPSPLARFRRRKGRTRGQSLVEFALVLPVFLLFFGAVLDLGRIAAAQVTVTNVAREAAFQAADTPTSYVAGQPCNTTTNLVICRALLEANGAPVSISPSDISMTCSPSCTSGLGNRVSVNVVGHFTLLTPFMGVFFGGQNVTFSSTSTNQIKTIPQSSASPAPSSSPSASPSTSPSPSASPTPSPTPTSTPCLPPSAGFTYDTSPSNGKAPLTLTVTDTSTPQSCISSWLWTWGDGLTTLGKTPGSHTYVLAGTYSVTLTVTNSNGLTNTTGAVQIKAK